MAVDTPTADQEDFARHVALHALHDSGGAWGAATRAPALHPAWAANNKRVQAVLRKDLFFVVGCQKSGTTWVMKLLNEHPQVVCAGEANFWPGLLPLLQAAFAAYNEQQRVGPDAALKEDQLVYLFLTTIGMVLGNVLGDQPAKCLGEKTPEHALIVPVLAQLLPRAKFIHIIRDGRDAAVSGWFQNVRLKGEALREEFPDLASYVDRFVTGHWLTYIKSARSIAAAAPHRYFELRYEDLHSRPRPIVRDMLAFLDVDAGDDHVRRCVEGCTFERCSGGRRRGQADDQSFFRKGIVGDWKNHFDERSTEVFMTHGGPLLRELGYD